MHPLLKHVLILDIETASGVKEYNEMTPEMRAHWDRKSSFLRNEEEKSSDELFDDRAAIYAEFGKIVTIGIGAFFTEGGTNKLRVKSFSNHDEKSLLKDFIEVITKFDQDSLRLCGHNGKEFDFPYLSRRMIVNQLEIPWALDLGGKKPWEVNHIDTMELWKFGDRKNFTSLKLLTDLLGIPSSKSELDGSIVSSTYYGEEDGLQRIETYCRGDVVATAQLYLRLNNLPLLGDEDISTT